MHTIFINGYIDVRNIFMRKKCQQLTESDQLEPDTT